MATALIVVFIIGYLAITLEHPLNINKAATALVTGVLCWSLYVFSGSSLQHIIHELHMHMGEISGILFFLLGAMTIVELIDAHQGFDVITGRITSTNKKKLMWIVTFITFFLSAVLDNLTTAIVMATLCRKLIPDQKDKMIFLGMVIISANAGGAWSPIGDVTTTMLWIGGQVTTIKIMTSLLLPSIICTLVPLMLLSAKLRGSVPPFAAKTENKSNFTTEQYVVLFAGIGVLIFVPVFKTITGLPPYMGILLGLGILWIITELIHKGKAATEKDSLTVAHALRKIDSSSILFFLGILLAVSALQSIGQLRAMADFLEQAIGNQDVIVVTLGFLSSIIDNVPLVAAAMGMYDLAVFPVDHHFWVFLAYAAGTGGSSLIIGSAAGVAIMGMEKIEFFWYLRNISVFAILGYLAGALFYLGQYYILI